VIGEAVRRLPPELTAAHPEIPWAAMRGMRNHIVHGYDTIDLELVWKVGRDELPPLAPALEAILGAAGT
jgi:uncharacterized protein with HEPN domain